MEKEKPKYRNKNWPKEPTAFDIGRMENAEAKRNRKEAKRLLRPLVNQVLQTRDSVEI